jgi:hypothetical protein
MGGAGPRAARRRRARPRARIGWLELTLGDRSLVPAEIRSHGDAAMELARRFDNADLEASALVLGRASVLEGDVEAGRRLWTRR